MRKIRRRAGQAVTIQTVALKAGVSLMTVSNVLTGAKNVRDETREAVMSAVAELGYVPNTAARALASARSTRVGIVYRNTHATFLSAMLVGALNAAERLGTQVIVHKCEGFALDDATKAVNSLIRSGANAILLAPPYCEVLTGSVLIDGLEMPICAIAHGAFLTDMDCIGIDETAAARAMTDHLIAKGHRRIGFVTGPATHAAGAQRLQGFREALQAADLETDDRLVQPGDFSFESGLVAARALLDLDQPPSAIFASNDDMAAAVSLVAHQKGLDIPGDLAVAGFDDAPIASKIWPPLTTVRQDIEAMADRATEMLINRHRAGALPSPAVMERMAYRLVERSSV